MGIIRETTPYYDERLNCVYVMESGETITLEAPDCWGNQLVNESVTKGQLYERGLEMNPCCGPVGVKGAEPGDTVKITIVDIETAEKGRLAIYKPEFGVLSSYLEKDETIVVPVENGIVKLHNKYEIPENPMLGVLAVTPPGKRQSTLLSGTYGGNMDCNLMVKGTVLYLPVQIPEAKIITGDVHALQGNGEVLASLEIPAKITIKVDLIKGKHEKWPILETDEAWYVITSGKTSDEANGYAMTAMADFLTARDEKSNKEWLTLMGLVGNANICKVVDTFKTSRFGMKKEFMSEFKF